jgi:glycolate oxidase
MADIYRSLAGIVGEDYVSAEAEELYFYARDAGLMPAGNPDYIVAPKSTAEVQNIVILANKQKIPIVPLGGSMALSGLTIPHRGGIVMDMKRMRSILTVNENARHVVVEGGTSQGALYSYLNKNYPHLQHNIPEAPPATTVAASVVIHGQGRLTQQYGYTSDLVSGMEVVLPTGEICKIGSCSMSPDWFSKGATLPDISSLFLGWAGTTGIITKLGIKLFPRKKMRDVETFVTDRAELVPDILFDLTHTEVLEDILGGSQSGIHFDPPMLKGYHYITMYYSGDTDDEMEFKRKMIWDSLVEFRKNKDGGFMWIPPTIKPGMLETPQKWVTRTLADEKKGGGFTYTGPIVLIDKYPVLAKKIEEVGEKYDVTYAGMMRVVGRNHAMMYGSGFPFNRADPDLMERVRKALHEMNEFSLEQGGIPWKADVEEQKMAMERMDPNTLKLMKKIKHVLDPNGIMNPGNWEVP